MDRKKPRKSWKAFIDSHGPQSADQDVKIEREEFRQPMLREDFRATWRSAALKLLRTGKRPASAPAVSPTIGPQAAPAVDQHLQKKPGAALPAPEHQTEDRIVRESCRGGKDPDGEIDARRLRDRRILAR